MLNRLPMAVILAAFTQASCLHAATLKVAFQGPDTEPAPYQEVTVLVVGEDQQSIEDATRFRSEQASFENVFEVEPGEYHVLVFTGTWEQVNDANKPGAFRSRETVELTAEDSSETVTVKYQPIDLKGFVGTESGTGVVKDPNGDPVKGFKLRLTTMIPSAGLYVIEDLVSDEKGEFRSNQLASGQQYMLMDAEQNPVGQMEVGSPTEITLAPRVGDLAPNVRFVHLESGALKRLADFKGKVVVIDFWASWCGPCQVPMANMQKYRKDHPDWGDKVELIALSIDNTKEAATNHLESRGWDQTYNAWAGDGGFNAEAPKAYAVQGIPQVFVIDQAGKIVVEGHPMSMNLPEIINGLLEKTSVGTGAGG